MRIESLKKRAREQEQNEEWQKALDQYQQVLTELAREQQEDIGLYNRLGDLSVRVGELDEALEYYGKAVELYREAHLPNNAIAVCKKILRSVPQRHCAYLLMGQIRAEQGFVPDARTNFLTYADRMAADGDLDESFRALIEFCDGAPDDVDVRVMLAERMVVQGREGDAVAQLAVVYRHLVQVEDTQQAEDVKSRIVAIDPEFDVETLVSGTSSNSMEEAVDEAAAGLRAAAPYAADLSSKPDSEEASGDNGFIDLEEMILGDLKEKSARFTVPYDEPSGDEQADFNTMLAQFKDKIDENLDNSDVRAHYDLGTAYKEMGLLEEAIGSFQAAVRASADHLPSYELMGQTFIEMGQPEAAVKSMERAVQVSSATPDELVGIYYYLGLAYHQLKHGQAAVDFSEVDFSRVGLSKKDRTVIQ